MICSCDHEHMLHRLQVLVPVELDRQVAGAAARISVSKGEWVRRALVTALASGRIADDPVARLVALDAPTADIDQMLAEIDSGRRA